MIYLYLFLLLINKFNLIFQTFINPIDTKVTQTNREIFLGDPTILMENNKYYLYGSSAGGVDSTANGFSVYESSNLKNWVTKGYALKKGDAYGESGFWAPQVFKKDNLFYMVYVANENIALAKSNSPLGPFKSKLKNYFPSETKLIDPFIFYDNNKWYLFHVRRLVDGNEIYVIELNEDLSEFKRQTLTKCFSADKLWENSDGIDSKSVQGPSVFKLNNVYYLFYICK